MPVKNIEMGIIPKNGTIIIFFNKIVGNVKKKQNNPDSNNKYLGEICLFKV